MDRLNLFIESERARFINTDSNKFAFSFFQIARYYEFIRTIISRHDDAGLKFVANTLAFTAAVPSGDGSLTHEQQALLEEGRRLTSLVHLEIESFYLFAKILLDKIARSIEFYFGPVRGRALDSHDDLVKNFGIYSATKKLRVPGGMPELSSSLKKDVSDFRDYEIAHEKSPRRVSGTVIGADGRTKLASINIYPTPNDRQVESKNLDGLLTAIDAYIDELIELVTTNRHLTKLKLGGRLPSRRPDR